MVILRSAKEINESAGAKDVGDLTQEVVLGMGPGVDAQNDVEEEGL